MNALFREDPLPASAMGRAFIEPAAFRILIGASSKHLRLRKEMIVR